jgi:SpoVK/Ycf46/Vps4 family AAA+-type ATPase
VTNRIEQIDPAFRRRFAYHLELKSPPPGARAGVVRKTLEGVPVSDAFVARLTGRKGLTPAQIRTAARFADLATPAGADKEPGLVEGLIERQLRNADLALGNLPPAAALGQPATAYDLAMLNLHCKFEIGRVVLALQSRGHGTLCFYGPPGTGKSALAQYMATQLNKPLIIRQASDLMSKYIGETEQNMAAMFREAEAEGAILLLDEADSFLQDRRGAQRTYEVTEVNEMLQGMERFHGIFICTTNLMDRVDQAALRRFTFKIQFKPLNALQREAFFIAEACLGNADLMDDALRHRLALLDQLCVGDFAAVQRQAIILDTPLAPLEFLEQLEAEHRIKPEVRESRGMGFLQ